MKKQILPLLALSFALALLTSCGGGSQKSHEGETISITHSLGTVEVPLNPQRVVVLDFSALENLHYLGIKPVGITYQALPSHLASYGADPSIANVGSINEPDLEAISELDPDLIIIGTRLAPAYQKLSAIAPVIYPYQVLSDNMLATFKSSLEEYGKIFQKEEEMATAYAQIEARATELRQKVEASGLNALTVIHNQGRFSAYGSGSRFGIIYDVLGFRETVEGLDTHVHGNPVSNEFIQTANPDVLFIVDRSQVVGNVPLDHNSVENQLVQQTNAAKNKKIFYLNPEAWYLAGGGIASVQMMIEEVAQAVE